MENRPQQIPFDTDEFAPDVIGRYIEEHGDELSPEFETVAFATAHMLVHQELYLPHEVENARLFYKYMFFPQPRALMVEEFTDEELKDLMENRI